MREGTPDANVEVRGIERRDRGDGDGEHVLRVAVPTANPRSSSRDSEPDPEGERLVGELPVTNADPPDADRRLNAEFVTALDEQVRAYYPMDESWVVVLTWDAATDEWDWDRRELDTYSFEPEDVRIYDGEAVVWRRVDDETAVE